MGYNYSNGEIIGRWIIHQRTKLIKSGKEVDGWIGQCKECGYKRFISSNNKPLSGCDNCDPQREAYRKKPKHDLTNKKFNHLVALKPIKVPKSTGHNHYTWAWICQCECGNIVTKIGSKLLCEKRHHCGCKTKENSKRTAYKDITGETFARYKRIAKQRKLEFNVTIEFLWRLYIKQDRKCALTGIPLIFSDNGLKHKASLDRINSNRGYTEDNVQWVIKEVNIFKLAQDEKEFYEICKKIVETLSKKYENNNGQ